MKLGMICLAVFFFSTTLYAADQSMPFTAEQMEEIVGQNPTNYTAMNMLGSVYMNNRQYDKAEMQFKKLIQIAPDFAPVYINYGLLEEFRKNYATAVLHFKNGFLLNEKSGVLTRENLLVAHMNLGHCYGWLKQNDSAIGEYERVCQLGKGAETVEAHRNLGFLYLTKAMDANDRSLLDKGKEHFDAVLSILPNDTASLRGKMSAKQVEAQLGAKDHVAITQSKNTIIVVPKQYEAQAQNLKAELDRRSNQ